MSKRESKKEDILLAGIDVMKRQGYNGTSVKDIVDAAGVPKGSFYNYFDSKESFALDAIEHTAACNFVYSQGILSNQSKKPLARLEEYFSAGIDCACDSEFKVGCFLGNMCQEMSDTSDSIRNKLKFVLSNQSGLIAKVIEEHQTEERRSAPDAKTTAEFLFNAWEGSLMRAKAAESKEPFEAFMQMLRHLLK